MIYKKNKCLTFRYNFDIMDTYNIRKVRKTIL